MSKVPDILYATLFKDAALRQSFISYLEALEADVKNDLAEVSSWEAVLRLQGERNALRGMRMAFNNHYEEHLHKSSPQPISRIPLSAKE